MQRPVASCSAVASELAVLFGVHGAASHQHTAADTCVVYIRAIGGRAIRGVRLTVGAGEHRDVLVAG